MANIQEVSQWEPNIYELATTDPLEGGTGGILNEATQQLTNRTLFLKDENTTQQTELDTHDTEINALNILAAKYFPKNRGYITGVNVGDPVNTIYNAGGDVAADIVISSSPNVHVTRITMAHAMSSMNYKVIITIESNSAVGQYTNLLAPVFKPFSTIKFDVVLRESVNETQDLKIHFDVISLD